MSQSRFVIMKHEANKAGLHYDLRFRIPNSKDWDSYAVRKGVPTEPGQKVLAVKTTIHSEQEALLTGVIKSGYGAGKLTKWDEGTCEIIKYSDKHIVIDFNGKKVAGIYHFINTTVTKSKEDKKSYFLFKSKVLKEMLGMLSRIPSIAKGDEVEEEAPEDGKTIQFGG